MFLTDIFISIVYQPFLNLLIFIYWLLNIGFVSLDMGVAVIILSLIVRAILLPMSLIGHKKEPKKREIAETIKGLEEQYRHDPIMFEKEKRKVFHKDRRVVIGEMFSFGIQLMTSLMLWKLFATGLKGHDLELIYPFMPNVPQPFDLMFLGRFDLTHPSLFLNLIQSILIFVLETISVYTSPYPTSRSEVLRLQFFLPVISFIIFMGLPAGKKLFIITSLIVSICLSITFAIRRAFFNYAEKQEEKEQEEELVEKIVVEN